MKFDKTLNTAINRLLKKGVLATASDEELANELNSRKMQVQFPIDVFPAYLKSVIGEYVTTFKVERSYVGLSILNTAAALMGKTVLLKNGKYISFPKLYVVLMGQTSSYKSQAIGDFIQPLQKMHLELSEKHKIEKQKFLDEQSEARQKKETLSKSMPIAQSLYEKDVFMFTLKRKVLPNNPRGFMMFFDEMKSWFASLDGGKKNESQDESEWLSLHNDKGLFLVQRGGDQDQEQVENPFICLMGGTQPAFAKLFFERNRNVSGFAARFIFGICDEHLLVEREEDAEIDMSRWENICQILFKKLHFSQTSLPYEIQYSPASIILIKEWKSKIRAEINGMENNEHRQMAVNWFGKAEVHLPRIVLILYVLDLVCQTIEKQEITETNIYDYCKSNQSLDFMSKTTPDQVERAIKVIEYTRYSMRYAYDLYIQEQILAGLPIETKRIISLLKTGMSMAECYELLKAEGYDKSYVTLTRYIEEIKRTHKAAFN